MRAAKSVYDPDTNSELCPKHLRALLWYQGESDAAHKDTASTYKTRFLQFLDGLLCRRVGGAENLPVVQVAITAKRSDLPYLSTVREQQLSIGEDVQVPGIVGLMWL